MLEKRAFLDVPSDDLRAWLAEREQPPMRARQVRRWILHGRAESFEQMTDLPRGLRQELTAEFLPLGTQIDQHHAARDDTHKLLLRLHDGRLIECVLIQEDVRKTACISTQVGCGMGCGFCASGMDGVARNLTVGEIVEQLVRLRNLLPAEQRLSHVVVMGMGEPLANMDNLIAALEQAGAPDALAIGARHVTISTVGLPNRIRQLADLGKKFHLAVSLHAPNDELRTQIMPTNAKTGIAAILAAADYFFERTGRQVTCEYVVLGGVNDSGEQARELTRTLSGRRAHVNLIPFNEVPGLPYRRPSPESVMRFVGILKEAGVSVKVRKRKGSEIDAACGQLRRKVESESHSPSAATLGRVLTELALVEGV